MNRWCIHQSFLLGNVHFRCIDLGCKTKDHIRPECERVQALIARLNQVGIPRWVEDEWTSTGSLQLRLFCLPRALGKCSVSCQLGLHAGDLGLVSNRTRQKV